MKVFKDLTIYLPPEKSDEFIASLENALPTGWIRDKEAESRLSGGESRGHIFIVCDKKGSRMSALVALVPKEGIGYYISNIVPRESSELTYDQYNLILDEFADICVSPVTTAMGLKIVRTSATATLDHWLSEDSLQKFRRFSGLANKSTGTSHPLDKARWYDFIIAVATNGDTLDASTLARYLSEEDGWNEDIAHEIAIEYEQEVGLLRHYLEK